MNGLEKIIEQIDKKAEKKRKSILEEAEKKANEKKSEAKQKAKEEKKRITEKSERETDQIKRRILASARKKARQKNLNAREEIIQKVLEEARKELSDLRGENEKYRRILKDLITAGGIAVGGGKLEVSVLRNDKKMLSDGEIEEMAKEISGETDKETSLEILANLKNADGGAVVQKSDGSISCNNTFKAKLERMSRSLRSEISDILFES